MIEVSNSGLMRQETKREARTIPLHHCHRRRRRSAKQHSFHSDNPESPDRHISLWKETHRGTNVFFSGFWSTPVMMSCYLFATDHNDKALNFLWSYKIILIMFFVNTSSKPLSWPCEYLDPHIKFIAWHINVITDLLNRDVICSYFEDVGCSDH